MINVEFLKFSLASLLGSKGSKWVPSPSPVIEGIIYHIPNFLGLSDDSGQMKAVSMKVRTKILDLWLVKKSFT